MQEYNNQFLESLQTEIANFFQEIYSRPEFQAEFKKYQDELDFEVTPGDFMVEMEMLNGL